MEPGKASASTSRTFLWLLGLLGILGVASWLRSQSNAPSKHPVEPIQAQDNTSGNCGIGEKKGDASAGIVTVTETPEAKAKREHATKRRQTIQRFRKAGGAWLSLGTFIVVLAYAVIARNQWQEMIKNTKEAKRSAELAQIQFEASERPWIKIVDVQTRGNSTIVPALSFQHSPYWTQGIQQTTFQLDIAYKNIGRSVARVTVDFDLFLPVWKDGYSDVILAHQKKFCDSNNRINSTATLSVINFPGDETYHWYGAGAALVTAETTTHLPGAKVGFILPVVSVCVNYQFGDSPKVYQTRALYEVFRKDNRTRFFEVGTGVPARSIFLIRNPSGDAAN